MPSMEPAVPESIPATGRPVLIDPGSADTGRVELGRFLHLRERTLSVDHSRLRAAIEGRVVLVTGGTGCIGTAVVRELLDYQPRGVIVVSRGRHDRWPPHAGVEYHRLDIRSAGEVDRIVREHRPDIVYHLAAQHDPGLAERRVAETLSTNVLGTMNVIRAVARLDGTHLAIASTGKALRPFSRDVYAGSKKAAEWVARQAAAQARSTMSAVRFTHVVDNSIILGRLQEWCRQREPIRLHDARSMFYIQSAREAAQLIIGSALDPIPGVLTVEAIRDLGWPMSLLDLAVGVSASTGSCSPIQVCGYEAGYESSPYPALYDPAASGDRSPLFSSLEVAALQDAPHCAAVDRLLAPALPAPAADRRVAALGRISRTRSDRDTMREAIVRAGWATLQAIVHALPDPVLSRHDHLVAGLRRATWSPDDTRIASVVAGELHARRSLPAEPVCSGGMS